MAEVRHKKFNRGEILGFYQQVLGQYRTFKLVSTKLQATHKLVWLMAFILFGHSAFSTELSLETRHFLDEDLEPYLEIQFRVPSESIEFTQNENGKWQGAVKIDIKVTSGKEQLLLESYDLFSPELENLEYRFDLIDIKRIRVKSGVVKAVVRATDYITGESDTKARELIFGRPYLFSDIMLVDGVYHLEQPNDRSHKNFYLVPMVTDKIPETKDTLVVYLETYQKAASYNLTVYSKNNQPLYIQALEHGEGNFQQHLIKIPRLSISSGRIAIRLEKREGSAALKELKVIVPEANDQQRFMAYNTWQLKQYIDWIAPIAGLNRMEILRADLVNSDSNLVKANFYEFWQRQSEDAPWIAWVAYQREVAHVDKTFGMSMTPGYKTDRGRVFLQYGAPIDIVEFHDNPHTYPYEMWQYGDDGKTGNSRFYFVNQSFTHNNFSLVHSTALGEIQFPGWSQNIQRGNQRDRGNSNDMGSQWEKEFSNE